jgi:pimeloyl-ACP methyl ester carboxylesterase
MGKRTPKKRTASDELRGAARLVTDATIGISDVIESMHRTIGGGPAVLGRPLEGLVRLLTAPVYVNVRSVTRAVGAGVDLALSHLATALGDNAPSREREAVIAALNGVLGDYLAQSGNPLAIDMRLRRDGAPLELEARALRESIPDAGAQVVVLVHGSSMSDLGWRRNGDDFGAALARDRNLCPLYLHYNSGLHISTNGHAFAELLEQLFVAWPCPIEKLVLVAHSMGGLVSRSACRSGEAAGHRWRRALDAIVFLGTPHHGAPLERGGAWLHFLMGVSRYSAPLGRLARIRSAGVTDLRFGFLVDDDWQGHDRFAPRRDRRKPLPLPEGVRCYAIAGTTSAPGARVRVGDGLVPVDSALGRHKDTAMDLGIPPSRWRIVSETGHLGLLESSEVYARILEWI